MGAPVLMEPSSMRAERRGSLEQRLISVVVPVVERADDLVELHRAFAAELESRGESYEFLFVFDGGFTPSPELTALSREREDVRVLRFARTFGETAALRLGIERSKGDVILTLPAYFQVTPNGIHAMLAGLEAGSDVVVASRSPRIDSWFNRLQSAAFHRMLSGVTDRRFHDMACGVRLMRRSVAEALPLYGDLHRFIPALALREGYLVDEVPVPQHPKDARTRMYSPGVYARRLLDIAAFFFLAKFTEKPLRFFGRVGLLHRRRRDQPRAAGGASWRPGHRQPSAPAARGAAGRIGRAAHGTRTRGRDHRAPEGTAPAGISGARAGLSGRAGPGRCSAI
jgi:glycosyltransferase involved in cell wall biosynthesis